MKCEHCGSTIKDAPAVSRAERAEALSAFLKVEFANRIIIQKPCPAYDIAELAKICLEKDLASAKTRLDDRLFSLFKHLHAFTEDLKPYGPKSRRAGYYRVWMTTTYGQGKSTELIQKAKSIYKELT